IALRHLEDQPVGENPSCMRNRNYSVAQRFRAQLTPGQPVSFVPERGDRELNGVFEVAALGLEMVGPQIHSLRPHNARERFHVLSAADFYGSIRRLPNRLL